MNVYVGNLSYQVSEEEIRESFEAFGQVLTVKIIKDKFTGESKGFGFVEMENQGEAEAAINELNGKEMKGRRIVVNEARPKTEKRSGGGGGGDRQRGRGRGNWDRRDH